MTKGVARKRALVSVAATAGGDAWQIAKVPPCRTPISLPAKHCSCRDVFTKGPKHQWTYFDQHPYGPTFSTVEPFLLFKVPLIATSRRM